MSDSFRLFRQEAIDHSKARWLGEARLSTPIALTWLILGLVFMAFAFVVLIFVLQYTRRVTVSGELRSVPDVVRLSAPQAGQVVSINAREGDHVHAGEILATISDAQSTYRDESAAAVQLRALGDEARTVVSGIGLDSQERSNQIVVLRSKSALVDAQMAIVRTQIRTQSVRVATSKRIAAEYQNLLSRGYSSDMEALTRRDEASSQELTLESLQASLVQLEASQRDVENQIASIDALYADKSNAARQTLSTIVGQSAAIQGQDRIFVHAPASGIVTGIVPTAGQHVGAGSPLLSIVPMRYRLVARLVANDEAIGLAKRGEKVLLRIEAFPFEQFGLQEAVVTSVSRSNLAANSDAGAGFLVYASLDRNALDDAATGASSPLRPGMHVSGDILLERRPISTWLFGPISRFLTAARQ